MRSFRSGLFAFVCGWVALRAGAVGPLDVGAGEAVSISSPGTYSTITVNGRLKLEAGAAITADAVRVGWNGGTGVVEVVGGARISAATVDLGSCPEDVAIPVAGCGTLSLADGATVEADVWLSRNCPDAGASVATSPTNAVVLGADALLVGSILKRCDPWARLAFAGGILKSGPNRQLVSFSGRGGMFVDSVDGAPIHVDCGNVHSTFPSVPTGAVTGKFCIRGTGDFIREGHPTSPNSPLHMSGYNVWQDDWSGFTGRIVVTDGGIRWFRDGQADRADGSRAWHAENGGMIYVAPGRQTVASFTSDGTGYISTKESSAQLVANVADAQTWDVRSPAVSIRKMKGGELTLPNAPPDCLEAGGGTVCLAAVTPPLTTDLVNALVSTGATLRLGEGRDLCPRRLYSYGTVDLAKGVSMRCGTNGGYAEAVFCDLRCSGDIVKTGAGTATLLGVNPTTGKVKVEQGTLRLGGVGTSAKYWRFTVKNVVSGLDGLFQLGELELRAPDGARVNAGLRHVSEVADATELAAGTSAFVRGRGYPSNADETLTCLFDGNFKTKCCAPRLTWDDPNFVRPQGNDSATWIQFVFRLADTAKPAAWYQLVSGNDAAGLRNPDDWTIESSADGVTWTTHDERVRQITPKANCAIFNDGLVYPLTNCAGTVCAPVPNTSEVTVAPGAELALVPRGTTLNALTIDCATGAGTVRGFSAAANGVLRLVNVASPEAVLSAGTLPITFADPVNTRNLSSWRVYVNGVRTPLTPRVDAEGRLVTLSGESGFLRYRFKVDKVGPMPDGQVEYMQMSELRLFDEHETDVTDRYIRFLSGSQRAFSHEPWSAAVDGVYTNKWVDQSPVHGETSNLWLRLDFPEPVKVTSYAWWTGNDAVSETHWRDPVSWRMQGSNDGRTWVDLDVRTDYDVPTNRNWRVGPFGCPPPVAKPVDAVDPWMGTGTDLKDRQGYGGMSHPGARVPFGLTQVVADRSARDSSNYMFPDATAEGISCTRLNGVGYYGDFGNFLVRPTVDFRDTFLNRAVSSFLHRGETGEPGRYGVFLGRFCVDAQTAATAHGAMMSFVYPETRQADLCIDLARRIALVDSWSKHSRQSARVVGSNALEGEMYYSYLDGGWGRGGGRSSYRMYFHAEFSRPLEDVLFYDGNRPFSGVREFAGSNVVFTARFPSDGLEPIALKVAFSYTDLEGARRNFAADFPQGDFDVERVAAEAKASWERALDVMTVEGGTARDRAVFASCLFFALQDPRVVADVDGRYRADDKVWQATNFAYRTVFSGWDVFRSQMPLLSLIAPQDLSDTVNSLMATMEANDRSWLPVWDIFGCDSACMNGNPAIPTILTAYAAGIRTFDAEKALAMCERTRTVRGNWSCGWSPGLLSETLEYAFDDWCTGRLAQKLGLASSESYHRSMWYTNCWSREVDWMRSRMRDGSWMYWSGLTKEGQGTTESNPYQQGWYVPHDPRGLIRLCGGSPRFVERLEEFMRRAPGNYTSNSYYNHSNEPVHLVPFLFHYAGRPDLTQKWTRRICANAYDIGSRGLCGAEDEGQMTAWYVLTAAGLHPSCPGDDVWIVTSPLFDKVTIKLDPRHSRGGTFTITAKGNSAQNVYIQSARLNGRDLDRLWLGYDEILSGGTLELTMGAEPPDKPWTRPPNPMSRTTISPGFLMVVE